MTKTTSASEPTVVAPVVAEAAAMLAIDDGYPEGHYPQPRRMGEFDKLQLGSFVVAPEDQLTSKTYFGLRHTDTFFDVLITNDQGTFYLVSNSVRDGADGTLTATPWLGAYHSSPDGLVPDARYTPWAGGVVQTLTTDNRVKYSLSDAADVEEFSFGATAFEWKLASGNIHLTGTLAGNGTQWRLPWREPEGKTGEMFYNQQGYHVEGVYFGEAVTGHVVLETMWGNEDYTETWWVRNRFGHWAFFVNNYDDGTSEYGQILCGEFGARGVVIVDEQGREVLKTTDLNAAEESDGRIVYDFGDGEPWEFVADPERGFPPFGATKLAVGAAKRVGETRKIVSGNGTYLIANAMGRAEQLSRD